MTHFAGEAGKWFHENWRIVVVVVVVIVVEVVTFGAATAAFGAFGGAILTGIAAGAAGGALGAALYGGSPDEILQSTVKGAVIGAFSAAAFYGVGSAFTPAAGEELTTTSQIEWTAAHGVVGGAKSIAEGGNFWKGFIAAAATKATSFGGSFDNFAADTARAAVVGGTVARISGDKFENGAITGAFSYAFNDYAHSWGQAGADFGGRVAAVGAVALDISTEGLNLPFTFQEIALGAAVVGTIGFAAGELADDWSNVFAEPPENAWDPTGPKAPGYPGGAEGPEGYEDPKGGPNWVDSPTGKGRGWESKDGSVWVPTGWAGAPGSGTTGPAHGGPHWDVQYPSGEWESVYPGGRRR